MTSEKRTTVTIRSIQDYINDEQCHWVPTGLMHADALTKEDQNLRRSFQEWLAQPTVTLIDEKKDTSVNFCVLTRDCFSSNTSAVRQTPMCRKTTVGSAGPLSEFRLRAENMA